MPRCLRDARCSRAPRASSPNRQAAWWSPPRGRSLGAAHLATTRPSSSSSLATPTRDRSKRPRSAQRSPRTSTSSARRMQICSGVRGGRAPATHERHRPSRSAPSRPGPRSREALELVGAADLTATVLRREGASALGYGVTEGEPELREVVAAGASARGLETDASEVLISAGALQAIDLACRVYLRPADAVVVESPGFANALSAFRNHGAAVLEVPVDGEGLDVAEASRIIRRSGARPRMFFVVPNFQNPSGETLSLARRESLLALAASYDAIVVEDDPYGLLRYRGADLPPLAALGSRVDVVSIGTFSKTFLPGLRVGWAIASTDTIRRMAKVKQTMDSSTGTLAQRIVLEFHRRGGVDAHVGRLRELYRHKQDRARTALAREFAGTGVTWNDPDGGFYFWVRLPHDVDARRLLDVGLEEGVAFVPGQAFAIERDHSSALRFSISGPSPERIDEGVRRLRRAFDRVG